MEAVGMLLVQVGRMKGDPLFIKAPHCRHADDGAYLEAYSSGGDTVNLVVHYEKSKYDDAKLGIVKPKDELEYTLKQIGKVQDEINRGYEGRRNDLAKLESDKVRLSAIVSDFQEIIDNPKVETFKFKLEECV